MRMSQGVFQKSSFGTMSPPALKPTTPSVREMGTSLARSRPLLLTMVPVWSCTATILAPASAKSSAATEPTLPKPCTAMRAPRRSMPRRRAASRPVTNTPRPVAFTRPSEPPRCRGFPVTTPVAVPPTFIE